MRFAAPCLLLLPLLGGCAATTTIHINNISPVCQALVGPIKYNSTLKTSARYAGPALAPDLRVRNEVGINLGCPAYRR